MTDDVKHNKSKSITDYDIPSRFDALVALPPNQRIMKAFGMNATRLATNNAGKFTVRYMVRSYLSLLIFTPILILFGSIPPYIYFQNDAVGFGTIMLVVCGGGFSLVMFGLAIYMWIVTIYGQRAGVQQITGLVRPRIDVTVDGEGYENKMYLIDVEGETFMMTSAREFYGFIAGEVYQLNFVPSPVRFKNIHGQVISAQYIGDVE